MTKESERIIRAVSIEYGALDTPNGRFYSVVKTVQTFRGGLWTNQEVYPLVQGVTPANDEGKKE